MATWLHKDGEKELVDPVHVPAMLEAGWSGSEDDAPKTPKELIREAAKAAGIEKWDTKRISTLKTELGYDA